MHFFSNVLYLPINFFAIKIVVKCKCYERIIQKLNYIIFVCTLYYTYNDLKSSKVQIVFRSTFINKKFDKLKVSIMTMRIIIIYNITLVNLVGETDSMFEPANAFELN